MPKRHNKKPCVYCRDGRSGPTGDHIIPRGLLLNDQRENMPTVPACKNCNDAKSQLEHDLISILPFGNRHTRSKEYLEERMPGHLEKNKRRARELIGGYERIRLKQANTMPSPHGALPFDTEKYLEFSDYVGRALLFYHYQKYVPKTHDILSVLQPHRVWEWIKEIKPSNQYIGNFGEGNFKYVVNFSDESSFVFCAMLTIYEGLQLMNVNQVISGDVGILIARKDLIHTLAGNEENENLE